jgi:hypothetical protein
LLQKVRVRDDRPAKACVGVIAQLDYFLFAGHSSKIVRRALMKGETWVTMSE